MKPTQDTKPHPLIKAAQIKQMEEKVYHHPLNPKAVRHTKSLGDALGMSQVGVHLVRVQPGAETSVSHYHYHEEEFLYVLSGKGMAEIGEQEYEVGPGDFMGFTAPSLPHTMRNPFDQDLVYLMAGQRKEFDVVELPRLKQRLYKHSGLRQLVNADDVKTL